VRQLLGLLCVLVAAPAWANDADALLLADQAPTKVERASEWQVFIESALGEATQRNSGATMRTPRLSLDIKLDTSLSRSWRFQFADRLDMNWQDEPQRQHSVNTLKETYMSWQPEESWIVDLGRINVRNGVATGYNPTDFFRDGAVRSVVSVDPASLKRNRLGGVMLRGQTLWTDGSLTALYSPKLAQAANDRAFSPDFGATNNRNRWLLTISQQLSDRINPQWLIYGQDHMPPQLGFNLTTLVSDATVTYVEWSGGRQHPEAGAKRRQTTKIDRCTQGWLPLPGVQGPQVALRAELLTGNDRCG
jgi:hypothetical protein